MVHVRVVLVDVSSSVVVTVAVSVVVTVSGTVLVDVEAPLRAAKRVAEMMTAATTIATARVV
jgi:hypothetical protein